MAGRGSKAADGEETMADMARTARLRLVEAEALCRDISLVSSLLFSEDGQ